MTFYISKLLHIIFILKITYFIISSFHNELKLIWIINILIIENEIQDAGIKYIGEAISKLT